MILAKIGNTVLEELHLVIGWLKNAERPQYPETHAPMRTSQSTDVDAVPVFLQGYSSLIVT